MTTEGRATTSTPTLELRRVHIRDLAAVIRLERRAFGREAWGWAGFLVGFAFGSVFLQAARGDEMLGFVLAQARWAQGVTWLLNIAVAPDQRNQGIGRALMLAVEAAVTTPRLRLTVRVDNPAARHLYRSLGYEEIGLRRGYYGQGRDGIEMEKYIAPDGPRQELPHE